MSCAVCHIPVSLSLTPVLSGSQSLQSLRMQPVVQSAVVFIGHMLTLLKPAALENENSSEYLPVVVAFSSQVMVQSRLQ